MSEKQPLRAWITHRRVHSRPDCPYLAKSKVEEVPVDEIGAKTPCRQCFPNLVDLDLIKHDLCRKCGHRRTRPCPHNGGVQVRMKRAGIRNGRSGTSLYWVWPENALFLDVAGYGVE